MPKYNFNYKEARKFYTDEEIQQFLSEPSASVSALIEPVDPPKPQIDREAASKFYTPEEINAYLSKPQPSYLPPLNFCPGVT